MSNNYPEHEKLSKVKEKSQAIGEFLDWLLHEKKVHTERFHHDGLAMESPVVLACYYPRLNSDPVLLPLVHGRGIEELLAEFYGIDLKEIESEKQMMFEEMRKMNQK